MAERSPPLASDIDNLVVLHAANPSDHHDTGPVITLKFHTLKISVPIIRRIVAMRLYILFQIYVDFIIKQGKSKIIIIRRRTEYTQNRDASDKMSAASRFDCVWPVCSFRTGFRQAGNFCRVFRVSPFRDRGIPAR